MVWSNVLADLIVAVHASLVMFAVFGLVAILAGIAFRWAWVRNFWFRAAHLAYIGVVVLETALGLPCPLTEWEKELRRAAGQAVYPGDFLGKWVHQLIFFRADPWIFTALYFGFGLAVVAAFVLAPPRWPGRPGPAQRVPG
jgi:hypothetical protein